MPGICDKRIASLFTYTPLPLFHSRAHTSTTDIQHARLWPCLYVKCFSISKQLATRCILLPSSPLLTYLHLHRCLRPSRLHSSSPTRSHVHVSPLVYKTAKLTVALLYFQLGIAPIFCDNVLLRPAIKRLTQNYNNVNDIIAPM